VNKYYDLCWLQICCFLLAIDSTIVNKQPIDNQCLFNNHIKKSSKRDSISIYSKLSAKMLKLQMRGPQPGNCMCNLNTLTPY